MQVNQWYGVCISPILLWTRRSSNVDKFPDGRFFRVCSGIINSFSTAWPNSLLSEHSALDDLVQNVQFMVELIVGFSGFGDLAHSVQHRGVVAATKRLADFRQ